MIFGSMSDTNVVKIFIKTKNREGENQFLDIDYEETPSRFTWMRLTNIILYFKIPTLFKIFFRFRYQEYASKVLPSSEASTFSLDITSATSSLILFCIFSCVVNTLSFLTKWRPIEETIA